MKTIIITLIPIISFILGVIIISIYSNNSIARNLIISSFSNLLNNLPLNFRLLGYDPSDVEKYWQTLRQQDQSALDSEQKALKIDLLLDD